MPLKSLQFQMRLRRRGRIDLAGNTVNLGSIQDVWHGYFCVSKQIMFSEGHLGSSPLLLKAPCGHRAELDTKDLEGCLSFLRTKAIKFCFKHLPKMLFLEAAAGVPECHLNRFDERIVLGR
ncbi:unnamed protein product, partial [Nesidiocoris tenuis]